MSAPSCVVLGFGAWGQRVYDKLLQAGVDVASVDPYHPCADAASVIDLDFFRVTHAVVATPPSTHRKLAVGLIALLPSLTDLRLEKPGCVSEDELADVVAHADDADVQVSVGYTLLADPLYAELLGEYQGDVVDVVGVRMSASLARHDVCPLLDLGSHTASIAAALRVPARIHAYHDAGLDARVTSLRLSCGESVQVLEHSRTVISPCGRRSEHEPHDALRDELDAFIEGAPLVGSELAIDAHRILAAQALVQEAAA